ncbi:hypothetical protein DB30_04434 [Enhygromyxa salina]|uniref:Uncharacterized protein n=2 Tax=Enhygromyxa salina TaxID=215803 RepID=A0A0C2CZW3_9BACT|nr:hypothetical protein DB30_04434 [Enhygromyxa salina]
MSFTLSIEGNEQTYANQDLPARLADVASETIEFLILTRDTTGEYIQSTGAYGRLVVERRDQATGAWKHYRIYRRGGATRRLPARVPGYEGYPDREVLDVDDVAGLFADFVRGKPTSAGFELLDVSAEMGLEDGSAGEA